MWSDTMGWTNGYLPMIAMAVAAFAAPWALTRATLSHRRVAAAVGITAVVLVAAGAVFLVWQGMRLGNPLPDTAGQIAALLQRSLRFVLLWGPILALAWLTQAQAVEARRGRALQARTDR
jgi:hypothetical protein